MKPHNRLQIFGGGCLLLCALAGAALVFSFETHFIGFVQDALAAVAGLGVWAPVLYTGLYVAGSVLCLPCFPLTLGAGFVFGLVAGFPLALGASALGALCAFLVGRYLARHRLQERLAADSRFRAIDRAVTRDGWRVVLLVRFGSLFPYNVVNYSFGVTGVPARDFLTATLLGRIPITAAHTYVGSLAKTLANLDGTGRAVSPLEWAVYGFGWLATLAATLYISRLAARALAEPEPEPAPNPSPTSGRR
jgi:uncharacterized membrane protein YdjX (TVP38/TMEM64 family)